MSLQLGDEAPNFTADTTQGRITLHDHLGDGWGVLVIGPDKKVKQPYLRLTPQPNR